MRKKIDFKSIFIGIIFIAITTTTSIATLSTGLNLFSPDLSEQEQEEFDSYMSSSSGYFSVMSGETKLLSFPKQIQSIDFSKDSGFSIRTLVGGEWKDMTNNPIDYGVMQGYIVRNYEESPLYISVDYSALTSAEQTLYQSELKAGWNLFAPAAKDDYCKAVGINDALQGTNFSQIIDFSEMGFKKSYSNEIGIGHVYSGETLIFNKTHGNPQKFREDGNYVIKNKDQTQLEYIYEGSAYGVFVNNDTYVSGNQNITNSHGQEFLKYKQRPVVVFKDNLDTKGEITTTQKVELLNFDLTSKYAGEDTVGTSSILASLSLIASQNIENIFENIELTINGEKAKYTISYCSLAGEKESCNIGSYYMHLENPELLVRGKVTNISISATPKKEVTQNFHLSVDFGNILILDDQKLLPYCINDGSILGTRTYKGRDFTIQTQTGDYSIEELSAAKRLAQRGIIPAYEDPEKYNFREVINKTIIARYNAGVAGLQPKTTCERKFNDVTEISPNSWLCGYVEALLDNGLIDANPSYFPLKDVTKAEMVKSVLDAAGENVSSDTQTWKQDYVNHAVEQGYIQDFTNYDDAADKGLYYILTDAVISKDILGKHGCLLEGTICAMPNPPKSLSGVYTQGNIDLSWETLSGAVKYEVSYTVDEIVTLEETVNTNFRIENVDKNKNYFVQVRGVDAQADTGIFTPILNIETNNSPSIDINFDSFLLENIVYKSILSGEAKDILFFDIEVQNQNINVGNLDISISKDVSNVINKAELISLSGSVVSTTELIAQNNIYFSNLSLDVGTQGYKLKIYTNTIENENNSAILKSAQVTGLHISNIESRESNEKIADKNIEFQSAMFEVQPIVLQALVKQALGNNGSNFTLNIDKGNNKIEDINITDLHFEITGSEDDKTYVLNNIGNSSNQLTAKSVQNWVSFNLQGLAEFSFSDSIDLNITPTDPKKSEPLGITLNTIEYMFNGEDFVFEFPQAVDLGTFTY